MSKSPEVTEVEAWLEGNFRVGGYPVAVFARWQPGVAPNSANWNLVGLYQDRIPLADLTSQGSPPGLIYTLAAELGQPGFEFLDGLLPDFKDQDLDLDLALSWRNGTATQIQSTVVVLAIGLSQEASPLPPAREQLQFFFSWQETTPAQTVIGIDYNAPITLPAAPGILSGLFDGFSITELAGVYSTAGLASPNRHTIPGITVFDVDTLTSTVVSQPLELSVDEGFSLLATLDGPGSTEDLVLFLPTGSSDDATRGPGVLAAPSSPASQPISKWFDVDKTFGPLKIQRVGLEWDDGAIGVAFDASITVQVLTLGLDGLEVAFNLADLADHDYLESVSIALSGLSLTYRSGPIEISGGFLETRVEAGGQEVTEYMGEAVIELESFSLSALGSFAELDGGPSLFVFALLEDPLGDPTATGAFFITGLAAGFGYNQDLILPDQDQVQNFPLVAAALDPSQVFPGGSNDAVSLQHAADVLAKYTPPKPGENWLAAGIRFTSWEMIRSFALLTVAYGTRLEVALLGLSQLTLPTSVDGGEQQPSDLIADVQMGLEVRFDPNAGLLAATAVLTPSSWILSPDCKLSGGFAFYVWTSGEHAGDFVVTLGGYNPSYTPPSWYPQEPRLAFNWAISPTLTCKGGCYFALTPHMVMAGGELDVVFHDGGLRAWLTAHADFLVEWQPFHYQIDVGVSVGASYTFDVLGIKKTISVSLGAGVHLTGPPFGGTAHVHFYVVSVTLDFGATTGPPKPLTFEQFQTSLLPKTNPATTSQATPHGLAVTSPSGEPVVCTARIAQGVRTGTASGTSSSSPGSPTLVTAGALQIAAATSIPATELAAGGSPAAIFHSYKGSLYIKPMQSPAYDSQFSVTVVLEETHDVTDKFDLEPALSNLPAALWSKYDGPPTVGSGQPSLLPDVPIGITLAPKSTGDHNVAPSAPLPLSNLLAPGPTYIDVDWALYDLPSDLSDDSPVATIEETIDDPAVRKTRADILARLEELGVPGLPDAVVLGPEISTDAEEYFLTAPELAYLGQQS